MGSQINFMKVMAVAKKIFSNSGEGGETTEEFGPNNMLVRTYNSNTNFNQGELLVSPGVIPDSCFVGIANNTFTSSDDSDLPTTFQQEVGNGNILLIDNDLASFSTLPRLPIVPYVPKNEYYQNMIVIAADMDSESSPQFIMGVCLQNFIPNEDGANALECFQNDIKNGNIAMIGSGGESSNPSLIGTIFVTFKEDGLSQYIFENQFDVLLEFQITYRDSSGSEKTVQKSCTIDFESVPGFITSFTIPGLIMDNNEINAILYTRTHGTDNNWEKYSTVYYHGFLYPIEGENSATIIMEETVN